MPVIRALVNKGRRPKLHENEVELNESDERLLAVLDSYVHDDGDNIQRPKAKALSKEVDSSISESMSENAAADATKRKRVRRTKAQIAADTAAATKKRGWPQASNAKRGAPAVTPLPANPEAIKKLYQGEMRIKSKALSKK